MAGTAGGLKKAAHRATKRTIRQFIGSWRAWRAVLNRSWGDPYLTIEGETVTSTVGAYRPERRGVHPVERIDGEHAAILGLPPPPLFGFLRQHSMLIG